MTEQADKTDRLSLIARATAYARHMHEGQTRKYTGEPYVEHCLEVAVWVTAAGGTPSMVAAALLHDVVEDTQATHEDIEEAFGSEVATLVRWVTDVSRPEDGNRAFRKALDRDHIAQAPPEAKTIKLADIISNTATIAEHGGGFARYYLKEKHQLLEVLEDGSPELLTAARTRTLEGLARLAPTSRPQIQAQR